MIRRLVLIGVLGALMLPATTGDAHAHHYNWLLAPAHKCANQKNPRLSWDARELVMRCMHNYARRRTGAPALRGSAQLQASADRKTADLIRCGFSHTACGRSLGYWFSRVGYTRCSSWRIGENIAWWPARSATVRNVMSVWLHSSGHRASLLSRSYRQVGLGLRVGRIGGGQAAVWTAHFGTRSC